MEIAYLPWKKRVKMSQSTESWIEQPSPFQHQKIQNISIGGGLKKKVPIPCVPGVCE